MSNTGFIEQLPDSDAKLYQATYSTGEDSTELTSASTLDAGTADCSADDNSAAELCVYAKSADEKIHNMKALALSTLPGVKIVMDASDTELTEALNSAGSDASYSTEYKDFSNALEVDVTAGESNRIKFQPQVAKSSFGSLPFDPDSDLLEVPIQLLLYWEDASYVMRRDIQGGKIPTDLLKESQGVELLMEANDGYYYSVGDIQDTSITMERSVETNEVRKGFPSRKLQNPVTQVDYMLSGSLEINEPAVTNLFKNHTMTYDDTKKLWTASTKDSGTLPSRKFIIIQRTVGGFINVYEIPSGEILINGGQDIGAAETPTPFEIHCNTDANGKSYYPYYSGNKANLVAIDTKLAVTLS